MSCQMSPSPRDLLPKPLTSCCRHAVEELVLVLEEAKTAQSALHVAATVAKLEQEKLEVSEIDKQQNNVGR